VFALEFSLLSHDQCQRWVNNSKLRVYVSEKFMELTILEVGCLTAFDELLIKVLF
jgi:hypothetical protein